jgi:histidinol-phosphatase (PHP family)
MNKLVGSGIFDIVGHFDLVKKFGYKPDKTFDDVIFEILKQVKRNNLCIEINTSGLRQKAGEPYPSMRILKMASDLKIPLTLGSDAHNPFDVGRDFNIAYEIISKFGEGRITVFEKREMKQVKFKK